MSECECVCVSVCVCVCVCDGCRAQMEKTDWKYKEKKELITA